MEILQLETSHSCRSTEFTVELRIATDHTKYWIIVGRMSVGGVASKTSSWCSIVYNIIICSIPHPNQLPQNPSQGHLKKKQPPLSPVLSLLLIISHARLRNHSRGIP